MNTQDIQINFSRQQFVTDICARCQILSRTINANREDQALEAGFSTVSELAAYIQNPEDGASRVILARAISKGIDNVKIVCQRFLAVGRTTDNNDLEDPSGDWVLQLAMPSAFNIGVTSAIKSYAHSCIVNYALYSILCVQSPDVASSCLAASNADAFELKRTLNARGSFVRKTLTSGRVDNTPGYV